MTLSKTIVSPRAAVASEQPLASLAGYDVLKSGGNAFDAAVATSLTLAVTFHPAGGLGGDFFGMFYNSKSRRTLCLNSSGWSPSGLTQGLIDAKSEGQVPPYGPLTCVVPGYVAGVYEMHRKLGTMDFSDLISRAIRYAKEGFPAGGGLCRSVAGSYSQLSPEARSVFAPSGNPTKPGETIKQPALASVLSEVSERGADGFYGGWPAEKIATTLDSLGVPCTTEDFSDFTPEWVDPLELEYRGIKVYEVPPNSMGATSLLMLKLLSEQDLPSFGPLSAKRVKATTDAALQAYSRRDDMLGDPRFGKIDLDAFMSAKRTASPPRSKIRSGDTTAFSIVDAEGNVVSGIQSLFAHFGSRVFVPECGIVLNNRASGFATSGPNAVAPRKRPLHTLSSLILSQDGAPYLSIGASGGDYRPMQHTLFVTNSVDFSMPAEQNVAHPRFLWTGGRSLIVEDGYEPLGGEAYEVKMLPMPGPTGVCQAVEISEGYRKGVCDIRGDGIPAGL